MTTRITQQQQPILTQTQLDTISHIIQTTIKSEGHSFKGLPKELSNNLTTTDLETIKNYFQTEMTYTGYMNYFQSIYDSYITTDYGQITIDLQ